MEYSIIVWILKTICGSDAIAGITIAKIIDYQILADQLNILITNLTVIFAIKKCVPTCLDVASFPLMLKVAKITNTICGTHLGAADVVQVQQMCAQITDDFMV